MKKLMHSVLAVAAACAVAATPALSFQETTNGGASKAPAPAAPKATLEPEKGGLNLSLPDLGGGKSSGTEVRIPGIGSVGVLPKLDFGLELLYGANESQGVPEEKSDPSELQIRGTLKHRF